MPLCHETAEETRKLNRNKEKFLSFCALPDEKREGKIKSYNMKYLFMHARIFTSLNFQELRERKSSALDHEKKSPLF
jgi:hypothetical protein